MNAEPAMPETPSPPRRTEAVSFRCRRRKFGNRLTMSLSILMALTVGLLFLVRHKGCEYRYEVACGDAMDGILLTMMEWEKSPESSRWLTGFFTREQFYSSTARFAEGAKNCGYLSDGIRLRMVVISLLFDRRAEAEEWNAAITESRARKWSGQALSNGANRMLFHDLFEFAQFEARYSPVTADAAGMFAANIASQGIATAAEDTYSEACHSGVTQLGVLAAGLPFLWSLIRLLMRPGGSPQPSSARLVRAWNARVVWGAWVRAEWAFLCSGLLLYGLSGLAAWSMQTGKPACLADAAGWWLLKMQSLEVSIWRNIFYVVLLTGPVLLMVRWLTPGFHATLRLFGIRRCPLPWTALWRTVLAGLTLVGLLYLTFGIAAAYFDINDPRDGWSRSGEPLWEGILFGCFVAPLVEEFAFRGFLFSGFRNSAGPWAAAALSSLAFALLHGYSLYGTILIACFGMLMCALYHRTGTLLVPMTIHALTNALLLL